MLANNTLASLFDCSARSNTASYNRDSFSCSSSSSNSAILPSLNQLPIPNLNHNKLPPIQSISIQTKSSIQQQHQLRYKCNKCTKSFNRKNSLVRHERVHTGNKPYSCMVCNKRFTRKDILDGHRLSLKCQRRTQFYLNNSTTVIGSNFVDEPLKVRSLPSSSTSSPDIDNSRKHSISSLLSSNTAEYYLQNFEIEQQWSPLKLPSLNENY